MCFLRRSGCSVYAASGSRVYGISMAKNRSPAAELHPRGPYRLTATPIKIGDHPTNLFSLVTQRPRHNSSSLALKVRLMSISRG